MRPIKYRYFIPENNYMGYVDIRDQLNPDYNHRMFQEHEVMQFTGLLDKNGKEIYEGDIVIKSTLIKKTSKEGFDYTVWEDRNFQVIYHYQSFFPNLDEVEIIGNIYENPKLLLDNSHLLKNYNHMSEYIPFSIKNNIENEDQAHLLDYMERELGWDIVYHRYPSYTTYQGKTHTGTEYQIDVLNTGMLEMKMKRSGDPGAKMLFIMDTALFMKAYKTLLCYYKD